LTRRHEDTKKYTMELTVFLSRTLFVTSCRGFFAVSVLLREPSVAANGLQAPTVHHPLPARPRQSCLRLRARAPLAGQAAPHVPLPLPPGYSPPSARNRACA